MTYAEIAEQAERLNDRDKLRLAQLLIQLARKEEEELNPAKRRPATASAGSTDPELLKYVAERLGKLKPSKKEGVLNSIGAMFQFQGGTSDADKEKLFAELLKKRLIALTPNNRVQYPATGEA